MADFRDIDSVAAMYDKIIAGVIHANTSKKLQSYSFAGLQNRGMKNLLEHKSKQKYKLMLNNQLKLINSMQMAGDGDDDLFKAYMEAVSMGGDIHNLTNLITI